MRPEKANIVSELSETLKRSPFVLVTEYRGMKVAHFSELRTRLAPAGAEVHVVKNNFLKRFKTFASEFKLAALKVGFVDRATLSTAELEALAELPTREILQAQLLGLLLSPATRLVRLLNEPASALARLLNAKAEKEGAPAA
jgi:large subunit ribosomal protein L10